MTKFKASLIKVGLGAALLLGALLAPASTPAELRMSVAGAGIYLTGWATKRLGRDPVSKRLHDVVSP